jgi:hypothetical protein
MGLGSGIRDPGFGKKTIPDPVVKKAPDSGSATVGNTWSLLPVNIVILPAAHIPGTGSTSVIMILAPPVASSGGKN